jgi:hypothetical protein
MPIFVVRSVHASEHACMHFCLHLRVNNIQDNTLATSCPMGKRKYERLWPNILNAGGLVSIAIQKGVVLYMHRPHLVPNTN